MYPVFRLLWHWGKARRAAPLGITQSHDIHVICWPWDIDPWRELNNGRTLTLYDLGRVGMGMRIGLADALRREGWGIAVAGSSVRYRHRVRAFERLRMCSRVLCWDARFVYIDQSLWNRAGQCASQQLVRGVVTSPDGIVPTADIARAMGHDGDSPPVPGWVQAWIDAEAARPWPPQIPD